MEVDASGAAIARKIGAGRSSVSAWRSGAKSPNDEARAALERAYGIPAASWSEGPREAGQRKRPAGDMSPGVSPDPNPPRGSPIRVTTAGDPPIVTQERPPARPAPAALELTLRANPETAALVRILADRVGVPADLFFAALTNAADGAPGEPERPWLSRPGYTAPERDEKPENISLVVAAPAPPRDPDDEDEDDPDAEEDEGDAPPALDPYGALDAW